MNVMVILHAIVKENCGLQEMLVYLNHSTLINSLMLCNKVLGQPAHLQHWKMLVWIKGQQTLVWQELVIWSMGLNSKILYLSLKKYIKVNYWLIFMTESFWICCIASVDGLLVCMVNERKFRCRVFRLYQGYAKNPNYSVWSPREESIHLRDVR